jgi:hypothetical protein
MRNSVSTQGNQAPRLGLEEHIEAVSDIALDVSIICTRNGIAVKSLSAGRRVPIEASVIAIGDDISQRALTELKDCQPVWTIIATTSTLTLNDFNPSLIATVLHNRHAAVVFTTADRMDHWKAVAGRDLVHVVVPEQIHWFGAIGGAE